MPAALKPYQLDAVKRMHNGCILCGGVGSGKSRTALAYYHLQNGGKLETDFTDFEPMDDVNLPDLYIITTAKKRDSFEWESEMALFLITPEKDISLYSHKVIVDSWNNIKKYRKVSGAFFIFDEQRVTGTGVWVKSFLDICRKNKWVLLSATPGDTWSDYIPVFVANGFYKHKSEFIDRHVVYARFVTYPKIERYLDVERLERLRDSILVDMEFYRKTVGHPEDVITDFDHRKYLDIYRNRWNPWEDRPIKNASELCYALRRVVNSDPSRELAVLDIFERHPRLIVFYNFDYELDILVNLAENNGVFYAQWNGHKHEPVPEGETWMYFVQYLAGAEGWNCITTDTIIFYSQNYSYKYTVQAAGRIDRLNTPFTDLYYYHVRSKSGIDNAIHRALAQKKEFNEKKYFKRI